MKLRDLANHQERCTALEKELKIDLSHIKQAEINNPEVVHCENHIGAVTIPLGIAGPVIVHGEHAKNTYYVPLATSEGALVASVSRGMRASNEKGVTTQVIKEGATRGPVFIADSICSAQHAEQWIWDHADDLAKEAQKTSSHIMLSNVDVRQIANYIYLRLTYDTDKAMGMNMATIASQKITALIEKKTKARGIAVAGNFDVDKKPSWMNFLLRRGYVVQAETIISKGQTERVLKSTPRNIYNVWKAKCMIGSAVSGSMGFNAHHANIVAAFFAATGQDLAHVVDGSIGMTIVDVLEDGSLYGAVYLPDIMLGTVGGGMKLQTQTEARSILKTDSPYTLAEILGAAVLSGELSLLASLAEGSLAKAHSALGR